MRPAAGTGPALGLALAHPRLPKTLLGGNPREQPPPAGLPGTRWCLSIARTRPGPILGTVPRGQDLAATRQHALRLEARVWPWPWADFGPETNPSAASNPRGVVSGPHGAEKASAKASAAAPERPSPGCGYYPDAEGFFWEADGLSWFLPCGITGKHRGSAASCAGLSGTGRPRGPAAFPIPTRASHPGGRAARLQNGAGAGSRGRILPCPTVGGCSFQGKRLGWYQRAVGGGHRPAGPPPPIPSGNTVPLRPRGPEPCPPAGEQSRGFRARKVGPLRQPPQPAAQRFLRPQPPAWGSRGAPGRRGGGDAGKGLAGTQGLRDPPPPGGSGVTRVLVLGSAVGMWVHGR